MEAEYLALSQSMRDLIPLREILKELQTYVFCSDTTSPTTTARSKSFTPIPPSIVHEDNESCLRLASLGKMPPRTKHIVIPYHFFRTKVAELEIQIEAIDTKKQLADQSTKGITEDLFVPLCCGIRGW